ncbi:MAG TPA: hypothetical protein VMG12_09595 [Polyangiaceae bacterium]|nr:hypothetical protein [Polyangiaceae bacterium]
MSSHRAAPSRLPLCRARWVLALLACGAPTAAAADLATAQPHELVVGPSRGFATAPAVDPARSRHATALPPLDAARVAWHRQVPGGIACNVLVDAEGRTFIVGIGRITQLGADGALQYSRAEAFSGALAAALLADGTRAVLTRDGRVLGWEPSGAAAFDVSLEVAASASASTLLPLPDGGVLASTGQWLFDIDATRAVRAYAALPATAQHTVLAGSRAIVIDEQGRVFEWDRREPLRAIGAFGSAIGASAIDAGELVALGARRSLQSMALGDGSVHELVRLDVPGAAPVLGWLGQRRWVLMKSDGSWSVAEPGVAPQAFGGRAEPGALSDLDLLVDDSGAVAWWASEAALHVETAPGVGHELSEVRCTVPTSLAPAGRGRLLAACGSGLVWLVGPDPARDVDR